MNRDADAATSAQSFIPIKPRRAFEEVIFQIEQAIMGGKLRVGDRLPNERELAKIFELSRQSVREGLRILEAFGVLSARRGVGPDSGLIVSAEGSSGFGALLRLYASLQRVPVWDLVQIRETLEIVWARAAAERAVPEETAQIVAAAEAMVGVTGLEEFQQLDVAFHIAIAHRSGNAFAPVFMEAVREAMAREMLRAFHALPDWPAERRILIAEHLDIANKIRAGTGEAAAAAISTHIRGFYGRALRDLAADRAVRAGSLRGLRARSAAARTAS